MSDGETTIIIDPGISWNKVKERLEFKTSEIAAVCLTHEHLDHSKAVEAAAGAGIDIYLLPETRKSLKLDGHRYNDIVLNQNFRVGSFQIKAFRLEHDVPSCGFLFLSDCGEKAVFIIDSFYCRFRFSSLNLIAIGINYSKSTLAPDLNPTRKQRLYSSHMSLENAIKFFNANDLSKVREIHLLHMSRDNSDPEMFKKKIQEATGKPVYIGGKNHG
jgi:phosphoribosyl 1,2-cyclic phosphodiesterase